MNDLREKYFHIQYSRLVQKTHPLVERLRRGGQPATPKRLGEGRRSAKTGDREQKCSKTELLSEGSSFLAEGCLRPMGPRETKQTKSEKQDYYEHP
jgi:hypothetical protein